MGQSATDISNSSFSNIELYLLNSILKISLEPLALANKIEKILHFICSQKQLYFTNQAAVFFKIEPTHTLRLKASIGFAETNNKCQEIQRNECHCGKVAITGKSIFLPLAPPLHSPSQTEKIPHYCIPISLDNSTIGVMVIYTKPSHNNSQQHIEFLESVGNIIASISEMQQMEEQLMDVMSDLRVSVVDLKEERKFSESIIQGMDHGLLVVDNNGRILKSNNSARAILHPFSTTLENNLLTDIFDQETTNTLLTPTFDTNRQEKMLRLMPENGRAMHLTFSNVAHEDTKGNNIGRIITISDISELFSIRKEMEKMNRLSTVAEIASAVAHEVRNPLAGIKIMAQSIEEDVTEGSEQHECSLRIIRQVDRLNKLLTEFFSYARPGTPNRKAIPLTDIIEETKHLIHNKLQNNKISLTLNIAPQLPLILADQNQMQQVFLNLFLNSIDAIQQGGEIKICAKTLTESQLNSYSKQLPLHKLTTRDVVVTFSDNGSGMSAQNVEKAFEPFFTTKTLGTGLGLSIVYRTLKENDASILLTSKEGHGTTFTLFFQQARQ